MIQWRGEYTKTLSSCSHEDAQVEWSGDVIECIVVSWCEKRDMIVMLERGMGDVSEGL
jgi:hypothetical protein